MGFQDMQKNNKHVIQNHLQASNFFAVGNLDKSFIVLSQCESIAEKNIDICQNLLDLAKEIKAKLEKAELKTQKDQKLPIHFLLCIILLIIMIII